MRLSAFFLGLLPFVLADVHKLKLNKIPQTAGNPELESLYLAEKYGSQHQNPLLGAGGAGRRLEQQNGESLYWSQAAINGGHEVPLSSMRIIATCTSASY